ncbi:MAG: RagB/SusD family nutrient uptake outer membrane protein [Tannerellaceae bacterium]|nr:RagB/SusD family nutrient uptake outer membrane protein [Tannerellaceae bacterium]
MKKIKIYILCGLMTLAATGCDYLDIVPDDTATLQDAFINELAAERFLRTCYSYQPNPVDFRRAPGIGTTDELVGSAHWNNEWFPNYTITWGLNNSNTPFPVNGNRGYNTDMWQDCYQGIRQCFIFLDNIETVVPANTTVAEFERNKAIWIGEVYFMIAYYHQLLFQQYGPVPVVEQLINDNTKQPRLPVNEVAAKITAFYDKAIETLPATWDGGNYGRASGEAALAMKAKTLLFAASPLFNGPTLTHYANLANKDGVKLIPGYDKERWKAAMDAAKTAIDRAKANGRRLYTFTGSDPITTRSGVDFIDPDKRQAYLNVRYLMVDGAPTRNYETIWANTSTTESQDAGSSVQSHAIVRNLNGTSNGTYPYRGLALSLQVVKLFYSKNGKPVETDSQRGYDWNNRMAVPEGAHSANLHLNREPRFYAAVGYSGGPYEFNTSSEYQLDLKNGGLQGWYRTGTTIDNDFAAAGYVPKKMVHPEGVSSSSAFSYKGYPYVMMRLADLYLMYVEACAHYNGTLDATALGYLKEIHDRAGLDGNNVYYATYSGDQLIEAVRRERMIELVNEGHWFYDLRRWLMADKWHNEGMWGSAGQGEKEGMWGVSALGRTEADFFKEIQLNPANGMANVLKYDFDPARDYLFPIRITSLNINDQLVQNPGY